MAKERVFQVSAGIKHIQEDSVFQHSNSKKHQRISKNSAQESSKTTNKQTSVATTQENIASAILHIANLIADATEHLLTANVTYENTKNTDINEKEDIK